MATRFSLRGPAWLTDRAAFGAAYRAAIRAPLDSLATTIKGQAVSAYSGTRFAAGFTYRTAVSPYTELRLFQRDPLFPYVEYPTRPHLIVPRAGGWLRWVAGGSAHFARTVHHPGTKGRNVIDPILAAAAPRFAAIVTAAVQEAATRG